MIFHFNDKGEPIGIIPERIIQGAVGTKKVFFVCPVSKGSVVNVCYLLSDGTKTNKHAMTPLDGYEGLDLTDTTGLLCNIWASDIPGTVIAKAGPVKVQFLITDNNGGVISTPLSEFTVEEGIAATEPTENDSYDDLLTLVAKLSTSVENLKDAFEGDLQQEGYIKSLSALDTTYTADENGNVEIPVLNNTNAYTTLGFVKLFGNFAQSGLRWMNYAGNQGLQVVSADDRAIEQRVSNPVITVSNLNKAVIAALSDSHHITLTDEQKATVQAVLGIPDSGTKLYKHSSNVTMYFTSNTDSDITLTGTATTINTISTAYTSGADYMEGHTNALYCELKDDEVGTVYGTFFVTSMVDKAMLFIKYNTKTGAYDSPVVVFHPGAEASGVTFRSDTVTEL